MAEGSQSRVLNINALLSALGRPYHGYHTHIYDKAAALVHSLIMNHPFLDGNKRTALYMLELLLKKSGYRSNASDLEIYDKFVLIADGTLGYEEIHE